MGCSSKYIRIYGIVDRVIHNLIKYKVTPISLAESLDEIMTREEEDGRSKI